ncbi:MAG: hypothetical protein OIN86_17485 [Candidatus Methanoperedens sp.]|nr:hypothetical protein [Candidatus Methanoperedens sp.]
MKSNIGTEIDWNELERCWANMYAEDYGHFSDHRQIIHGTRKQGSSAAEVCIIDII